MSDLEKFLRKDIVERLERIEEMSSPILSSQTVAKMLGIKVGTLHKITCAGNMLIPTAKIGGKKKVFLRKDVIAFVERNKQEAIQV